MLPGITLRAIAGTVALPANAEGVAPASPGLPRRGYPGNGMRQSQQPFAYPTQGSAFGATLGFRLETPLGLKRTQPAIAPTSRRHPTEAFDFVIVPPGVVSPPSRKLGVAYSYAYGGGRTRINRRSRP